jgi:hypothetical protein
MQPIISFGSLLFGVHSVVVFPIALLGATYDVAEELEDGDVITRPFNFIYLIIREMLIFLFKKFN